MSDETLQQTNERNALPPPDVDLRTKALVDWLRWIDQKGDDADYSTTKRSPQWIKIVRENAAFAFVARRDTYHGTLGIVKAGDVMFPASWSSPAKHARGNVLAADGGRSAIDQGDGEYCRPHVRYLSNAPNRPTRWPRNSAQPRPEITMPARDAETELVEAVRAFRALMPITPENITDVVVAGRRMDEALAAFDAERETRCPDCKGTGIYWINREDCLTCQGTGKKPAPPNATS